jgi:hypothetical protein
MTKKSYLVMLDDDDDDEGGTIRRCHVDTYTTILGWIDSGIKKLM